MIAVVKDLDAETMVTWKEKGWFGKLKFSLFRFFELETISELSLDQANRGLLLLNHLMILNRLMFSGDEEAILRILLTLHDLPASDKRSLFRGSLSVREELLRQHVSSSLLPVAFSDFENNWTQSSSHRKVFLLSTIIAVSNQPALEDQLMIFNSVITAGLQSKDAVVRKQTYPVLLHLMKDCSADKELLEKTVLTNLKEGERRLLDYYLNA